MTWIECHSQRIFIVDSIDKTPLAFVAVKYDKGSLYTNEKGWFNVDVIKGDTIELSLLGYKTKQIQTNKIKDTIYLSTELTQLDEVIVLNQDKNATLYIKSQKARIIMEAQF